jgi:hypothetical protein
MNKFSLPFSSDQISKYPNLIFRAFIISSRIDGMLESEIYGQASLLGTCEIPIAPIYQELIDLYGNGITQTLEFERYLKNNDNTNSKVIVARGTVNIKVVGDYITQ